MRHLNLLCKVGRAAAQPLATFDYSDPAAAEANCAAAYTAKIAELVASGVDISRVSFERVYVDSNGKSHASPAGDVGNKPVAKKGK